MALDTYGLPEEQYKKIFLKKAEFVIDLLSSLKVKAEARGHRLDNYTDKFLWDLFQEIAYASDEEARVYQKEHDPESVKKHSFDYGVIPTREEMMGEVKSLKKLMLTFVEQNKDGYLGQDRISNFPGEGA